MDKNPEDISSEDLVPKLFSLLAFLSFVGFIISLVYTSGGFRIFLSAQLLGLGFASVSLGLAKGYRKTLYEEGRLNYEPITKTINSSLFFGVFQMISFYQVFQFYFDSILLVASFAIGTGISSGLVLAYTISILSGLSDDDSIIEKDVYGIDTAMVFKEDEYDKHIKEVNSKAQS